MSFARSIAKFATGTLLSRVIGLVRNRIVAHVFGVTWYMDAFILANRIPNLFRDMLAEGALNGSFTKVYSAAAAKDPLRAARLLYRALAFCLSFSLVFCLLGIYFSGDFVSLMTVLDGGSFNSEEAFALADLLTKILFPFIGIMMVGAILTGVLHEKGAFLVSAVSPVALNVGYIAGALCLSKTVVGLAQGYLLFHGQALMTVGLAAGVLLGGLLQVLVQLFGMQEFLRRPSIQGSLLRADPDVKKVFTLMVPIMLASGASNINVIVNTNFAASMKDGSMTMLWNAFQLWQLPVGVFAVAAGNVILPALSKAPSGEARREYFGRNVQSAALAVLWLLVPCFAFLLFNHYPVAALIYETGAYTRENAETTGRILYFYSFGLIFYGLVKVLSSVYVALERTRFAMYSGFLSIAVNFAASSIFVSSFGLYGLPMAASSVLACNVLFLAIGLAREKFVFDHPNLWRNLTNLCTAFAVACALQWVFNGQSTWLGIAGVENDVIRRLLLLSANGAIVVCAFYGFALKYYPIAPNRLIAKLRRKAKN